MSEERRLTRTVNGRTYDRSRTGKPRPNRRGELCRATKQNGDPCPNPPMNGGFVCWAHGGRSPQVKAKAAVRKFWRDFFTDADGEEPRSWADGIMSAVEGMDRARKYMEARLGDTDDHPPMEEVRAFFEASKTYVSMVKDSIHARAIEQQTRESRADDVKTANVTIATVVHFLRCAGVEPDDATLNWVRRSVAAWFVPDARPEPTFPGDVRLAVTGDRPYPIPRPLDQPALPRGPANHDVRGYVAQRSHRPGCLDPVPDELLLTVPDYREYGVARCHHCGYVPDPAPWVQRVIRPGVSPDVINHAILSHATPREEVNT